MSEATATMPSEVKGEPRFFDRFAGAAALFASRAVFFACCVAVIVLWVPTFVFLKLDTWQLVINTLTTIVTFLMVALLQNTQTRSDDATQQKLNAIADGLADLMEHFAGDDAHLHKEIRELKLAVGLEERETTSKAA
ncbi:MAG: low affinity iron permease family protein [Acidimicrobiales bacterium]